MVSCSELMLFPPLLACLLALAFICGAVFASFITCVAGRLVTGESPWAGRSHCDACNHELSGLDLVPIASWLLLKGRCRYCGAKISPRSTVAEILLAVYFMTMVLAFGLSLKMIACCALGVVLLGLSLVDLDSFTIPNGFIVAGIAVWVAYIAALFGFGMSQAMGELVNGLIGGVGIAGAVLLLSLVFDRVLGKQSMGGGDIKLLFLVGLFLGGPVSLLNLIVACVFGLVLAFARGSNAAPVTEVAPAEEGELPLDPKSFPFGPAIAAATWFSLVLGQALVTVYLQLFF